MQVLREAMNDAPGPGEPETFPPDRIRGEEESLARSHQTAYTVVARHRASGEPAGLSFVCVHELRPAIAAQEDTSVVRDHRGHRLGLRMKLELYDWLRAARADVESVDTWNAPENAPMIAINDALGCRVVAETVRFTGGTPWGRMTAMATYSVNKAAVAHCRKLIEAKQYVLDSDWGDVQPGADVQNAYLEKHSWDEYAAWHLGLTEGANDETKARYAFVYGDLRRVHRTGLIACVYRASEWRHKDVELAAHDLLQLLDKTSG